MSEPISPHEPPRHSRPRKRGESGNPSPFVLTPRHSRERGNPAERHHAETARDLHSRQSSKRYALHWRNQRSDQTSLGTQKRSDRGIHQEISGPSIGLLRDARGYERGDHAGKTIEEMEPGMENRVDRENQSLLARLVGRHRRELRETGVRYSRPREHGESGNRAPLVSTPRHSRTSGNPAQRVRQNWIPAFAGMTAITIEARELRRFLEGLGYV